MMFTFTTHMEIIARAKWQEIKMKGIIVTKIKAKLPISAAFMNRHIKSHKLQKSYRTKEWV